MKTATTRLSLIIAFLVLLAAAAGALQSKPQPYALIFGTAFDPNGHVVGGVVVKVQREGDKKPKWERVSDRRGEFAVRVPPGKADYLVWAEMKGHKGHVAETKVHIENDERADVNLHLP